MICGVQSNHWDYGNDYAKTYNTQVFFSIYDTSEHIHYMQIFTF